jgi:acyl transferase domain-containing protein
VGSPAIPVYANSTAGAYPADPEGVRVVLRDQLTSEVRFVDEVEAMYAAGVRVFVEAGPGRVLTQLVGKVLGDRPHRAVACDASGEPGVRRFLLALAELAVVGVDLDTDVLFEGRRAPSRAAAVRRAGCSTATSPAPPTAPWSPGPSTCRHVSRPVGVSRAPRRRRRRRAQATVSVPAQRPQVVAAERGDARLGAPADAIEARVIGPSPPRRSPPARRRSRPSPRHGGALLAVVADRRRPHRLPPDMLDPASISADLPSLHQHRVIGELAGRIGLDTTGAAGASAIGEVVEGSPPQVPPRDRGVPRPPRGGRGPPARRAPTHRDRRVTGRPASQ